MNALKTIASHSFWASAVKYNGFHDQLVLSGGCDGLVNLHSCVSISSENVAPTSSRFVSYDELTVRTDFSDEEFGKAEDGLIKSYDHHEDTVNSVCWSANDPWVFATLSYDGNVIINKVPTDHKYKIML